MLIVDHARDLAAHEGQLLGRSAWMTVTQEAIDDYARLTGDDHWIHVDVERAAREMPGGKTIAHGLFIISLQPALQLTCSVARSCLDHNTAGMAGSTANKSQTCYRPLFSLSLFSWEKICRKSVWVVGG